MTVSKPTASKLKTEILLPNRIGDAILSLPAILCLKQLEAKFNADKKQLVIYPPDRLFEVIWSLQICETQLLEEIIKVHSWFQPADETFHLDSSSRIIGLRTKKSYGEQIEKKWFTRYTKNLPYLGISNIKEDIPSQLIQFLSENFHLSTSSIRFFGICLEMGYSVEQIKNTFKFDLNSLNFAEEYTYWKPELAKGKYLVFCMEAAYGTKREAQRKWAEENYFALAERAFHEYGFLSAFVGVESKPRLPKHGKYMLDLRGKLSLYNMAQLFRSSAGYIGNDTGPLHLANLMKVQTLGIYLSTNPETYGPIFPELNIPAQNPKEASEVFPLLEKVCQAQSREESLPKQKL